MTNCQLDFTAFQKPMHIHNYFCIYRIFLFRFMFFDLFINIFENNITKLCTFINLQNEVMRYFLKALGEKIGLCYTAGRKDIPYIIQLLSKSFLNSVPDRRHPLIFSLDFNFKKSSIKLANVQTILGTSHYLRKVSENLATLFQNRIHNLNLFHLG